MSDTPETDTFISNTDWSKPSPYAIKEFMQKLEKERNQYLKELEQYKFQSEFTF